MTTLLQTAATAARRLARTKRLSPSWVAAGKMLSTSTSMDESTALRLLGLSSGRRPRSRSQRPPRAERVAPSGTLSSSPWSAQPPPPPLPPLDGASASISTSTAFTARELRDAYFDAAKRCHPDSAVACSERDEGDDGSARLFIRVTEAYEYLRSYSTAAASGTGASSYETEASFVTKSEEEEFRQACREWLGVHAETVEESKRCPLFREWLLGRTDAAFHWNIFLSQHGGLAPKLRPPSALLGEGKKRSGGPNRRRRR